MKKYLFCFVIIILLVVSVIVSTDTLENLDNVENELKNSSVNITEESIHSDMVDNLKSTKFSLKDVKYINNTVSGGPYHILAVKNNGELFAWGDNFHSVLGVNSGYIEFPSQALKVMDNVKSISADQYISCAVDKNGNLWGWGSDMYCPKIAKFRDENSSLDCYMPVKIMDNIDMSYCDNENIFVLKTDKSLWGWGAYWRGQLADGRYNKYLIDGIGKLENDIFYLQQEEEPVKIMDNVIYVHSYYAIKSDGSLWTWGCDNNRKFGGNAAKSNTYPIQIMDSVKLINDGPYVIKNDNTLWTWELKDNEDNNDFQKDELFFQKIMDSVVYANKLYGGQSVAIKEDGSLWTWGENNFGQLGDGTTIDREEPMKVMDNVVYAAGNSFCTVALKNDGSLWLMGMYNDNGNGNDTENKIYKPHKIMDDIMLPY